MDLKTLVSTRLSDHLDELRSFVDGLTSEQISERSPESSLSLSDIARHLMDVQEHYVDIVSRILLGERPDFDPTCLEKHTPDEAIALHLSARLKDFDERRRSLVSLLNALSEDHWKMEGRHPAIPHYTLEKCMEELMRHEESHFFEMYRLFFGARNPV